MENQETETVREETKVEEKPKVWSSWGNPVATPEKWQEIKRAVEAGMSQREASEAFHISYDAIRQRSAREAWITETRLQRLAEEAKARKYENLVKVSETNEKSQAVTSQEDSQKTPQNASEALASSLAGYRSRTMLGLAKLAEKGVSEAMAANLTIENWSDAKIVADIACKLHGLGQDGVQVNVLLSGESGFEGPLIETESFLEDDNSLDD